MNRRVESATRIPGGRNNRLYQVQCEGGLTVAAKLYFRHPGDRRDRLGTEFGALTFLWDAGVRCVPRPLAAVPARGCGLYEFIEGARIGSEEVGDTDIDAAVTFLAGLHRLCRTPGSRRLGPASDAVLVPGALGRQLTERFARLRAVRDPALQHFLAQEFGPAWRQLEAGTARGAAGRRLGRAAQTLSPSDFGFHNALRRADGTVTFLDFEYFGWDDPAKMIADVLWHPQMHLSFAHKRRFVAGLLSRLPEPQALAERAARLHPWFGLKWCLIVLNEYLPGQLQRRRFAGAAGPTGPSRAEQLERARQLVAEVHVTHDRYPYLTTR